MIPQGLRYTPEHEWVQRSGDVVRVGITHFAQDSLGDIVFVELPEAGTEVTAGQALGEVESTKSVSDVYAPVSGTVRARNEALADAPDLINSDPYGEGWMLDIEVSDASALEGMLDAAAYEKLTAES